MKKQLLITAMVLTLLAALNAQSVTVEYRITNTATPPVLVFTNAVTGDTVYQSAALEARFNIADVTECPYLVLFGNYSPNDFQQISLDSTYVFFTVELQDEHYNLHFPSSSFNQVHFQVKEKQRAEKKHRFEVMIEAGAAADTVKRDSLWAVYKAINRKMDREWFTFFNTYGHHSFIKVHYLYMQIYQRAYPRDTLMAMFNQLDTSLARFEMYGFCRQMLTDTNYAIKEGNALGAVPLYTINNTGTNVAALQNDKTTYLYFWATWCSGCKPVLQLLETLKPAFDSANINVVIVSINTNITAWQTYVAQRPALQGSYILHPSVKSELSLRLGINGVPYGVLLNGQGFVVKKGIMPEEVLAQHAHR